MVVRFHWVRCQLDTIDKCQTPDDVEKALKTLPKDLNETYERILLKILNEGDATAKVAEKILRWLVGSMRPLRLFELEEAIMIEPGTSKLNEKLRPMSTAGILASCGSLLEEYKDEDGLRTVRLSHYTVQVRGNYSRLHYGTESIASSPSRNFCSKEVLPYEIQRYPDIIYLWKTCIRSSQPYH